MMSPLLIAGNKGPTGLKCRSYFQFDRARKYALNGLMLRRFIESKKAVATRYLPLRIDYCQEMMRKYKSSK